MIGWASLLLPFRCHLEFRTGVYTTRSEVKWNLSWPVSQCSLLGCLESRWIVALKAIHLDCVLKPWKICSEIRRSIFSNLQENNHEDEHRTLSWLQWNFLRALFDYIIHAWDINERISGNTAADPIENVKSNIILQRADKIVILIKTIFFLCFVSSSIVYWFLVRLWRFSFLSSRKQYGGNFRWGQHQGTWPRMKATCYKHIYFTICCTHGVRVTTRSFGRS